MIVTLALVALGMATPDSALLLAAAEPRAPKGAVGGGPIMPGATGGDSPPGGDMTQSVSPPEKPKPEATDSKPKPKPKPKSGAPAPH